MPYLGRLIEEVAMQGKLFDRSRPVHQLHWSGGTLLISVMRKSTC
jgi:oxygen-independent coproporphyrinogen-3 oxidase